MKNRKIEIENMAEYEHNASHILLYGEKINDSNKILATPVEMVELLKNLHPVLDLLENCGYSEIGRINLHGKWITGEGLNRVFEENYTPSLMNKYGGFPASPMGFNGLELLLFQEQEESLINSRFDLYLVQLNQSEKSKINAKSILEIESNNSWPSNYCWNIQGKQVESVISVCSSFTPTHEELKDYFYNNAQQGIVKATELDGDYRICKIGSLEKMPEKLLGPLSIVEERENSSLIGVKHYPDAHIDLDHLKRNFSIGYEIREIQRLEKIRKGK